MPVAGALEGPDGHHGAEGREKQRHLLVEAHDEVVAGKVGGGGEPLNEIGSAP